MSRKLDPEPQLQIFTLRRSIFIWFCGGVIGWAAAILLVYNVFQGSAPQMAQSGQQPGTRSSAVADSQNTDPNSLNNVAPAAGGTSQGNTGQ
jgi:hypothetical protein